MRILAPVLMLSLAITGCGFPGVHKNPVIQGNQLKETATNRVEVGMTQAQVQFLLGNPITTNSFNPDRWIYLERVDLDGAIQTNQYLIVQFEQGRVSSLARDAGGSPSDPLSRIDTTPPDPQPTTRWWWPF